MDPIIQSQIKSPLCRTLQSIPTNSDNFLHGIPDNTPPFSKTRVVIKQDGADTSSRLNNTQVFKLPQMGHLNNVYLRYRMIGHGDVAKNIRNIDTDNVFSFGHGIESIQLRTHNNVIQTIPAAAIPFEVASVAQSDQSLKYSLQALGGYEGVLGDALLLPPRYNLPAFFPAVDSDGFTDAASLRAIDFYVKVPLSSTFYLKDNFQTRLMEDLEIAVRTKRGATQFVGTGDTVDASMSVKDRHEIEVVAEYINFHENVEEVIRNETFKSDVPAVLLQSDYEKFEAKYVKRESIGSAGNEVLTYEAKLDTDALATDLFVVPKVLEESFGYEAFNSLRNVAIHFSLTANGNTLMEGYKTEIDGIEAVHYSTVNRQHQTSGVLPRRWAANGTRIRLGLNNTDEYFDGGISFQSLVEPKLTIRITTETDLAPVHPEDEAKTLLTHPELFEFDVVMKRKVMLRIDGNTGKIAKSLES